ncbi:hypothetical protein Pst134EA_007328 [Puccinia striiformis f. sp. tritici]|uniref:hypothetical protein n=1 Tax=Puccinia striiformis f. sp. tritici TaxID=168172 RepID=UPI002008DF25|nr:hypothetical protein Pst134EA_007328 [Puccinia striiformis f. sp. tritici]KAH9470063.1 hypothetical protein Pst134EA_007328 [Puccinia striiformis f. sp. tritici]
MIDQPIISKQGLNFHLNGTMDPLASLTSIIRILLLSPIQYILNSPRTSPDVHLQFNHHQLQQVLSKCVTVKSDLALNGQLTKSEICLGNINRQETNIQRLGKVVRTALCLIAAISASPIGLHKLHNGPDLNQPHLHLLMIAWAGFNPRTNS